MKLLAVDDIQMNLDIYRALIARHLPGCSFKASGDATEGIEIAKNWQPDVILMDYHMPVTDGMEAIRILKKDHSTAPIPVILLTAEITTPEIRTEGLESGADAFIQKPVNTLELIAQIRVMYRIRQAELKLREEQKALKAVLVERSRELRKFQDTIIPMLDNFPAMIWRTGFDGDCDWFNHTWLEFRGRTIEEDAGRGWMEGIHPDDRRTVIDINLAGFNKKEPFVLTCRLLRHDGEWRTIRSHGAPLYDPNGVFTGFLGACYDISDQMLMEEQLRQSQKMESIGLLAAGIAHDFNNILTVILGYASMLHLQLPPDSPHREAAGMIVESSKRASELVRQLLAFSRKQKEGRKVEPIGLLVTNFRPFLEQVLGSRVNLDIKDLDCPLYAELDTTMFEQVLMNLAINAHDAMPEGGMFAITTAPYQLSRQEANIFQIPPGSYIKISISDTGQGINEEIREKIFDPFFTTKDIGKGTGLGLSIVYSIIRQHGGSITIDKNGEKGTTFSILIPRCMKPDDK